MDDRGRWGYRMPTFCLLARAALSGALTNAAIAAHADPAPPADVTELGSMFSELCIADFPKSEKVDVFLTSKAATPMSASEVQLYLRGDPGRGWYIKTPVALYAVTVEDPPFHTCAIRRMTPEGAGPGIDVVAAAERTYASSIGGTTVTIKATNTRAGPAGPDVLSFGMGVFDATGRPIDSFGVFFSNYHGRVPAPWVADGTPGVGVEVRLSRQTIGH